MTQIENERLAVVEEKVKAIDEKLDKVIDDHEKRIRELEKEPAKKWNGLIAAIIVGLVGLAIGIFSKLFE